MALSILNSNYFSECSFPVIVIIILLILITVKLYNRWSSDSRSTFDSYLKQVLPVSSAIRPDIHETSMSVGPQAVSVVNLHEKLVDTSARISSPTVSGNTLNTIKADSWLNQIGEHLINTLKQYRKKQESGGCGLENLGYSCYINSALQCLYHIRSFVDIICNLPEQQPSQLLPITSAFCRLLIEMQSILEGCTSAYELKICISELNQRFAGNDQQDSHEFITVLIEALHDELMDNYQNPSIGDLMHGTITSTVKCLVCEEETHTDDSFLSLPLPIHRSTAAVFGFDTIKNILTKSAAFIGYDIQINPTLYDCFENLLAMEQLGANGQWFCQTCQKPTDATKNFNLSKLPRVLILQLKRFTYDLTDDTKITTKIHVEKELDLGRFIKNNDMDQPAIYDLTAILVHTGTLTSGHYTTFARHLKSPDWYYFNDQHVRRASLHEALTSDIYVLIYERQHSRSSS